MGMVEGISLVDGSFPRQCGIPQCGVRKLTFEEATIGRMDGPPNVPTEIGMKDGQKYWLQNEESTRFAQNPCKPYNSAGNAGRLQDTWDSVACVKYVRKEPAKPRSNASRTSAHTSVQRLLDAATLRKSAEAVVTPSRLAREANDQPQRPFMPGHHFASARKSAGRSFASASVSVSLAPC